VSRLSLASFFYSVHDSFSNPEFGPFQKIYEESATIPETCTSLFVLNETLNARHYQTHRFFDDTMNGIKTTHGFVIRTLGGLDNFARHGEAILGSLLLLPARTVKTGVALTISSTGANNSLALFCGSRC